MLKIKDLRSLFCWLECPGVLVYALFLYLCVWMFVISVNGCLSAIRFAGNEFGVPRLSGIVATARPPPSWREAVQRLDGWLPFAQLFEVPIAAAILSVVVMRRGRPPQWQRWEAEPLFSSITFIPSSIAPHPTHPLSPSVTAHVLSFMSHPPHSYDDHISILLTCPSSHFQPKG